MLGLFYASSLFLLKYLKNLHILIKNLNFIFILKLIY